MFLFKYLDLLPAVPPELLVDPIPNYTQDNIGFTDSGSTKYAATYTRWGTTPELIEWLRVNITEHVDLAGIQTMSWLNRVPPSKRKVDPHCDKRRWALNYVYETGGRRVATTLYQEKGHSLIREPGCRLTTLDSLEVVESIIIEPCRWHLLSTNVIHGVSNVETARKAVTIGLNLDNPIEAIKGYNT